GQRHRYLLGSGDDMVIGHDQTRWIDDETRSERGHPAEVRRARRTLVAEEIAKKIVERRRGWVLRRVLRILGGRRRRAGGNVHDHANETAGQLREHFCESCWIRRGPAWRRRLGCLGLARRRALRLLRRALRRRPRALGPGGRAGIPRPTRGR